MPIYKLTITPFQLGHGTDISWTVPAYIFSIGTTDGQKRLKMYLQRSETKNNYPLNPYSWESSDDHEIPDVDAAWTTIQSWDVTGQAAINALPVTVTDNTNPTSSSTGIFNYRLIMYVWPVGATGKHFEFDWVPGASTVNIGGGGCQTAIAIGGTTNDFLTCIVCDGAGNKFVGGQFSGTVNFGNSVTLTATGSLNGFYAKYDINDVCQWAKKCGVEGTLVKAIEVNQAAKTIGTAATSVYVAGVLDTCNIRKVAASNGATTWSKGPDPAAYSAFHYVHIASISIDSNDAIVTTGDFAARSDNEIDFGDSHPVHSSSGSTDAYVAKYNSSGTCIWVDVFGNFGDTEIGTSVIVDRANSNAIFCAGYHLSGIVIGGITIGNVGSGASGYLAKLDTNGTLIGSLARGTGVNDGNPGYSRTNTMALDSAGNIIIGGAWNAMINFGGGFQLGLAPQQNAFVAKYNGTTLAYISEIRFISTLYAEVNKLVTDPSNNIFIAGYFSKTFVAGTIQVGPAKVDNNNTTDAYSVKLNSSMVAQWGKSYGGTDNDNALAIALDNIQNPIIVGSFQPNVNLPPQVQFQNKTLSSTGLIDGFMCKLFP